MAEIFRGKVVDVSAKSYTVEITGAENKIKAFLEMIRPLGIQELSRTGKVAISRGAKMLAPKSR
jgi:acetolactate synthase-1/3 small subunit